MFVESWPPSKNVCPHFFPSRRRKFVRPPHLISRAENYVDVKQSAKDFLFVKRIVIEKRDMSQLHTTST